MSRRRVGEGPFGATRGDEPRAGEKSATDMQTANDDDERIRRAQTQTTSRARSGAWTTTTSTAARKQNRRLIHKVKTTSMGLTSTTPRGSTTRASTPSPTRARRRTFKRSSSASRRSYRLPNPALIKHVFLVVVCRYNTSSSPTLFFPGRFNAAPRRRFDRARRRAKRKVYPLLPIDQSPTNEAQIWMMRMPSRLARAFAAHTPMMREEIVPQVSPSAIATRPPTSKGVRVCAYHLPPASAPSYRRLSYHRRRAKATSDPALSILACALRESPAKRARVQSLWRQILSTIQSFASCAR